MSRLVVLIMLLIVPTLASAQEAFLLVQASATLTWSLQAAPAACTLPTPTTQVKRSSTATGTFATLASLPLTTTTYALPIVADNQFYKVSTACGDSNTIQYVAVTPPGPTIDQRVATLETKVAALQLLAPIPGPAGPQGIAGPVGARGPTGLTGSTGPQGLTGAQGLPGNQGLPGVAGSQGIQGIAGVKGDKGESGLQGSPGAAGGQGIPGIDGVNGEKGDAGPQGVQGPQGHPGPPGPPGGSPPPPSSNLTVTVLSADVVQIDGLVCTSLKTTGTGLRRILTCVH